MTRREMLDKYEELKAIGISRIEMERHGLPNLDWDIDYSHLLELPLSARQMWVDGAITNADVCRVFLAVREHERACWEARKTLVEECRAVGVYLPRA